jgi:hypothetical protein
MTTRKIDTRSPEAARIARELASLALARVARGGRLNVREREELRRALAAAADLLGWSTLAEDPMKIAAKDILKLARSGARLLTRELADEVADKKTEMSGLTKAAAALRKLAKKADFTDPVEFSYAHTARTPPKGLVTRIETLSLANATEAEDAARLIESKRESWDKLREAMLQDLKAKQKELEVMGGTLPEFVKSSEGLVRHVMAVLY